MIKAFINIKNKLLGKGDFRHTLKHAWTYFSSSMALKSLSVIGIPIMTRLLTPEDYGVLNIFATYATIIGTLLTLNLQAGVGRYYFEGKDDFSSFLGTSLLLPAITLFIFQSLILLFPQELADLLELPVFAIFFFVPFALRDLMKNVHLQYFRASKQPKKVRSLSLISGYIGFALGILLIYLHEQEDRYEGKLWSGLVMVFITGGIILQRLIPLIKLKVKKSHIKYMLSYSFPLLPAYLSSFILAQFDRVMIGHYIGKSEAGQYSFAYNISMLLVFVINAFSNSWTPKYYDYMNQKDYASHDRDVYKILSISSLAACGLILFSDWIGYILGSESFHTSLYLIPLIVLGQFIMAIIPIYKRHISFMKRTLYTSIIVLVAGAANVILNALYIPQFGSAAGAYTTVISYVLMFFLTYLVVRFILKTHVTPMLHIFLRTSVVFLACAFYYVELYLLQVSTFMGIVLKFMVLSLCIVLLFWREALRYYKP